MRLIHKAGDFYFCVVFDDGDQATAFLKGVGVTASESDLFVDGRKLAHRLGIDIPPTKVNFMRKFNADPKLTRLAGPKK